MSEYKSLTHIITDMLEAKRQNIMNVPRNKKTPRDKLPIVGRPDDPDRKSEDRVYTKQAEIQNKVIDETQIAQSKKPVDNVKKPKKLDITDVGKQPPTKVEVNPELEKTNVFASTEVKGKLIKEADSVSIQYQTNAGVWVTSRKTDRSPSNILIGMETVQKAHNVNRVRAVDDRGSLVDMIAQQPVRVQPVELPFGKMEKPLQTFRNIELPQRPEPVTLGKIARDIGSWIMGEETINEGNVGAALGKGVGSTAATSGISAALSGLKKAWPKTAEAISKIQSGYSDVTKFSPGYTAFATQKDMLPTEIVTDYIAKNKAKKEAEAKATVNELSKQAYGDYIPRAAASQAAKYGQMKITRHDDPKFKKLSKAFIHRQRGIKSAVKKLTSEHTIERALRRVIEARHAGIETDEPKFSQSIQKVAAHTKWNAGAVHTYKHADGSKTRVDQDVGEKIHDKIHSTPHRHRADLIQKMHKSSSHLKDALKESSNRELNVFSGFRSDKGKIKNRSGEAKALENPVFRKRVVKDKTKYSRKEKHKGERE